MVRTQIQPTEKQAAAVKGKMHLKERPNHRLYIDILRRMTPEKRLLKAFELSAFSNQLFVHGLRKKHPHVSAAEFTRILRKRLDKCHNRNY